MTSTTTKEEGGTTSGKSITQTERKSLEKLIEADYAILSREVHQQANEVIIRAKQEEAKAENADNIRAASDAEQEFRDLEARLTSEGFEVSHSYGGFTIKSKHLEEATEQIAADVDADMHKALRLLDVKKNQALRDLLRVTVSDAARELLDDMPTAGDIFREALQDGGSDVRELTA